MTVSDRKVLEAILLLADEPVSAGLMGEVLERPTAELEGVLEQMAREYAAENRGFVLRELAGGWRLYTDPDCAPWLERFVQTHQHARLTGAALEVLAIVAYRQPISRTQIAEIRGVDSDGVVKTLAQRGLLSEQGRDSGPGAPVLFTVSDSVLERLGLRSVDDLPPLSGFMPTPEAVEDMEAKLSPNA
ncbi:MAG: segregation and condensation protein [Actinomycetota bacterium]|nr:segregation and condensation protein [Actinomycetota bacterium]